MTRKRWKKLMWALASKAAQNTGEKVSGEVYRFYRDHNFSQFNGLYSYAAAWDCLKELCDYIGMKTR